MRSVSAWPSWATAAFAIVLLAIVIASAPGCAALQGQTADQRWYGALADYTLVVNTAASYCESDFADPETCRTMALIDLRARGVIARGNTILAEPDPAARIEALLDLARFLLMLTVDMKGALPPDPLGPEATP